MARGIGGEDGPSLFMFVAVILIWGKVTDWWGQAKKSVEGNLANPFQPETTEQIRKMEAKVERVPLAWSKLPKPMANYQAIADAIYDELDSAFNIDEDRLINLCKPLQTLELVAVYKCFGVKDATSFGIATATGDLFDFFSHVLTDSALGGKDLSTMYKIWQPTGLWTKTW